MSEKDKNTIEDFLQLESAQEATPAPIFFDLNKPEDQKKVQELFERESVVIRDPLEEQLLELTITRNPHLLPLDAEFAKAYDTLKDSIIGATSTAQVGAWIYLPWRRVMTHLLSEDFYFELRTAYNREIITAEEQKKFQAGTVGIAGLSTGNMIALAIVLQGGSQHMRLADSDILELANMNRIRAGIDAIGELKTTITAKQIYELDPFAHLELFSDGLTPSNIDQFLSDTSVLSVLIDTVDNIGAKAFIRLAAKKHHIPVVSVMNNGNDILLDVERYDLDPSLAPFNGGLGDINEAFLEKHDKMSPQAQVRLAARLISGRAKQEESSILQEKMKPDEQARLVADLMGPPNIAPRLQESLILAGKSVFSWPQVSNAVLASSGIATFATRRIILGQKLDSGRYRVSIEGIFDSAYDSKDAKKERLAAMERFLAEIDD